ncbi:MAG TPA: CPBP family intramembrane glutamic endopeptidase [Lysobacter sp.]|nr:CPBP family intramembrane glutamic endopeptidase [Lysobacter sp.]
MHSRMVQRPWSLDLRTAAVWGVLAGLSAVAVMPYVLQLMPETFEKLQVPLPVFVLAQGVQAMVLLGLLSLLGLRMGHRVGLGSPLMQAWLGRAETPDVRSLKPLQAIGLGVLTAAVIIGGSLVLDPLLPEPLHPIADPGTGQTALNGLLASFYGGIAEELLARLFVMTLIVWLLSAFGRRQPRPAMFWAAIVVAGLLFGAGHLPPAVELWGLSPIVVFRTIVLNAVAALGFGWLYWRRGIEMAMLGHFSADIVLHVLTPLAQRV